MATFLEFLGLDNPSKVEMVSRSYEQLDSVNKAWNVLGSTLDASSFSVMSREKADEFVAFIRTWIEKLESTRALIEATAPDEEGRITDESILDWHDWFASAELCIQHTEDVTESARADTLATTVAKSLADAKADFNKAAPNLFEIPTWLKVAGIGTLAVVGIVAIAYIVGKVKG